MDEIIVATIITEGGKLLSELIRSNQVKKFQLPEVEYPVIPDRLPGFSEDGYTPAVNQPTKVITSTPVYIDRPDTSKGETVAKSCVGCAIGHLATCSGLLKEAVRFAPQGMDEPHIIQNLNICLDELNAMERVDLVPDKILTLPSWEQALAHQALDVSRETRHFIESGIVSADQLERLSANLSNVRQAIGGAWLQQKLRALSKEDKEEIQQRVMKKLENIGEIHE
jgi:hypothetical protein